MTLRARVLTRFPGATRLTVNSTVINSGSSGATTHGVLFNKNGVLGEAYKDTSLSNGITGPGLVISSNAAAIPGIATILGGSGLTAPLTLATKDEGETIFHMASFGTESNSTIVLGKANGTAASPLPLLAGNVIGLVASNGWSTAGVSGGAPATAVYETRAVENFSSTTNGTGHYFFSQLSGTAYPTSMISMMQINAGGLGGVTIGNVAGNFYTPLAQDFGTGTLSMTGSLFINKNSSAILSAPVSTTVHIAQAGATANVAMFDSFAAESAIVFRRANGTAAATTAIVSGDLLGIVGAQGKGATTFSAANASISFWASQNWTDAAQGTYTDLITTANGGTTRTSALRVENDGGIRLNPASNPDASFGLGTISTTGAVYINKNASALTAAPAGTTFRAVQANSVENVIAFDSYAADVAIVFRRANGTQAVPTPLAADNLIGGVFAEGMGSTGFSGARANVLFYSSQTWTDANQGTYIDLSTTTSSTATATARVRIENDGGITVPSSVTGGSKGTGSINVARGVFINGLFPERIVAVARAVNFNSANTDNAISIPLPTGITNYEVINVHIANASASISTATWGLFTSTGGGGTAIFAAAQAITVTTASANTNNNMMLVNPTTAGTQSYNAATLQFRVGTAQGSAATADVFITISTL